MHHFEFRQTTYIAGILREKCPQPLSSAVSQLQETNFSCCRCSAAAWERGRGFVGSFTVMQVLRMLSIPQLWSFLLRK